MLGRPKTGWGPRLRPSWEASEEPKVWSGRESLSIPTSFLLSFPILSHSVPSIPPATQKRSLYFLSWPFPYTSLIIEKQSLPDSQNSRFNISTSRFVSDSFQFLIARVSLLPGERVKALPTSGNMISRCGEASLTDSLAAFVVPTPVGRLVSRGGRASG